MRFWTRALLIALISAPALAQVSTPVDVDGDWTLTSVPCDDGTMGEKRYEDVGLSIRGDLISAVLVKDGCEISIEGIVQLEGNILSAEFASGSWTACSGSLPTYVLNRFEAVREDDDTLRLSGTDLTPFGSCKGKSGALVFTAE